MDSNEAAPTLGAPPTTAIAAPGASLQLCPPGETAFVMASSSTEETKVFVEFDRPADASHWPTVFACTQFQSWVALYEHHSSLYILGIAVKYLNIVDGIVKTLLISPSLKDKISGDIIEASDDILLRHESSAAGILVMLRCSVHDLPHDSGRRDGPQAPTSRDFVLYTSAVRPAVGQTGSLEILTGNFNAEGEFVSASAEELATRLDIRMRKSDLVFLTTAKQKGVVLDPRQLHEHMHLYLYRQNITEAQLDSIPRAGAPLKTGETGALRLATLGEAWRTTTDTKSIAALFLFHEFRYHGKMPKYKPPRDAQLPDAMSNVEKRKPTFGDVDSLCPNDNGVNLRVKIVTPLGQLGEGLIQVGDSTGLVNLRVEGSQLDIPELKMAGSCLTIQNARVDILVVYLTICVDKWGKITPTDPNDPAFAFAVDHANNKSAIEYELVHLDQEGSPKSDRAPNGTDGDDRRRGRGGRGRGRGGRGGGRGRFGR